MANRFLNFENAAWMRMVKNEPPSSPSTTLSQRPGGTPKPIKNVSSYLLYVQDAVKLTNLYDHFLIIDEQFAIITYYKNAGLKIKKQLGLVSIFSDKDAYSQGIRGSLIDIGSPVRKHVFDEIGMLKESGESYLLLGYDMNIPLNVDTIKKRLQTQVFEDVKELDIAQNIQIVEGFDDANKQVLVKFRRGKADMTMCDYLKSLETTSGVDTSNPFSHLEIVEISPSVEWMITLNVVLTYIDTHTNYERPCYMPSCKRTTYMPLYREG